MAVALNVGLDSVGARWTRLATDALWVVFFIGASSAPHPLGIYNVERYFWLPADLAVLVTLFGGWQHGYLDLFRRHAIFLTWPALAIISTVWSLDPTISAYHGAQLLLTVLAGFMLCIYADLRRILTLLFIALLICAVASLAYVLISPARAIGPRGEWLGVFPHKNVLGHMMVILIFTALCLWADGWRRILTASTVVLAATMLLLTRSGAAMVTLMVVLSVCPLALSLRKGVRAVKVRVGLLLIAIAIVLPLVAITNAAPFELMLGALGKSSTLTGRTILWDAGLESYANQPWLGVGYKAYWESPETTAAYLRYIIGQDLWFFHNNFIDAAVAFGTLGPLLLIAGLCVAVISTCVRLAYQREMILVWPLLFVVFVTVLSIAENPLFQNHSLHQFLLIVAVAAGVRRLHAPAPGFASAYRRH